MVRVTISQLLAMDVALDKLGARAISASEAQQLIGNDRLVVRNPATVCPMLGVSCSASPMAVAR